ncbi:NhaA Na+/H+ antiporter [Candidatus Nanopelagicaceae bacterium]
MRRRLSPLQDFLKRESASGILLLGAAALGLAVANSPLSDSYFELLDRGFEIGGGAFYLKLTTLKIINYILMTIFFFVVGLEIKREMTTGHLSRMRDAIMPLVGALGGMAIPALIYLLIAGGTDARGWGVPVATDIALAVGLLAIIGKAVAPSLRTFLLGLAVIDDIGAILIIAFIYSTGVGLLWVLSAAGIVLAIFGIRKLGARSWLIYIALGMALWYFLYRSGIHATLSGVILGLLSPNIAKPDTELVNTEGNALSIIEWLEGKLHPWSSFLIVPIFAFANTGVVISAQSIKDAFNSPIAWGIFFGLVIGKPLGIIIAVVAIKRTNIGDYPAGSSKSGLLATGSAAGIGFTVAIFIADLAFKNQSDQDTAVIAVILASVVSGIVSWALFSLFGRKNSADV